MVKNVIITIAVMIAAGLIWTANYSKNFSTGYSWVSIAPKQCRSNPWEIDAPLSVGISEESAIKIFYQKQGIVVAEVVSKPTYQVVCLACNCPRGDTLYLSILTRDIPKMTAQGFMVAEKPERY